MSVDLKPRIQLRVVTNRALTNDTREVALESPIEDNDNDNETETDHKKKRGRPRKNPLDSHQDRDKEKDKDKDKDKTHDLTTDAKKRGRKKKPDLVLNGSLSGATVIVKNYVVQLKVRASDLETVQQQFIHKTQDVGYPQTVHEGGVMGMGMDMNIGMTATGMNNNVEGLNINHEEYFKLLNNLELPLTQVGNLTSMQKMGTVYGQTFRNQLPEIPSIYINSVIPVLPNRIPIRLFDEFPDLNASEGTEMSGYHQRSFKNTANLVLPQLTVQGQNWPQNSPYPCWNCDVYFDGSPIGIADKEISGKFHCYGNFCDFPCSARYLVDRESTIDFWNKYSLLCLLYQKVHGLSPDTKVPIAAPREALIKYGGKLSYEDYHQNVLQTRKVEIYKLPLVPVMLHIDELMRSTNINSIIEKNQNKVPETSSKNGKRLTRFIGIDPAKLKKAEENLKMKSQERLNGSMTLDDCFK